MKKTLVRFAEWANTWQGRRILCTLAAFAGALFVITGHAQTVDMSGVTTAALEQAANAPGDLSMKWWSGLLGEDFIKAPLTAVGAPSTVIGYVICVLNAALFGLGAAAVGLQSIKVIVHAATHGETSPITNTWMPVRNTLGVFGLIPAFHGFSLSQAFVVKCLVWGVGLANLGSNALLNSVSSFQSIVPASASTQASENLTSDFHKITRDAFLANLCLEADMNHQSNLMGAPVQLAPRVIQTSGQSYAINYAGCGEIVLSQRAGSQPRSGDSLLGFREPSVDYSAIAAAVLQGAQTQLQMVQTKTAQLADTWYRAAIAGNTLPSIADLNASLDAIEADARTGLNGALKATSTDHASALTSKAMDQLKSSGWINMGMAYPIFAEAGSAVVDAQRAFSIDFSPGDAITKAAQDDCVIESVRSPPFVCTMMMSFAAQDAVTPTSTDLPGEGGVFSRMLNTVDPETPLGGRSLGQAIATKMISAAVANTGGAGFVDPVIAAKEMGDMLMDSGEAGKAAIAAVNMSSKIPTSPTSLFTKLLGKSLGGIGSTLNTAFNVFIGLGLMMSVYLPMAFFIVWFSATILYYRIGLESVANSQFGALMHTVAPITAEGFTGGHAGAMKTWQHYVNVLVFPPLMVLAFLFAAALARVSGSYLFQIFPSVLAADQGNSTTGVLSIAAYLCVFFFLLFTAITVCANMIYEIPSAAIGWLGGNASVAAPAALGAILGSQMQKAGGGAAGAMGANGPAGMAGPAGAAGAALPPTTGPAKP